MKESHKEKCVIPEGDQTTHAVWCEICGEGATKYYQSRAGQNGFICNQCHDKSAELLGTIIELGLATLARQRGGPGPELTTDERNAAYAMTVQQAMVLSASAVRSIVAECPSATHSRPYLVGRTKLDSLSSVKAQC